MDKTYNEEVMWILRDIIPITVADIVLLQDGVGLRLKQDRKALPDPVAIELRKLPFRVAIKLIK